MKESLLFTRELIQAISDWQRGGDAKQKARRAVALQQEAEKLPETYKYYDATCYRQIALKGSHLLHLGTYFQLPESISSWTRSEKVAKSFKGGVPPEGDFQGVIMTVKPTREQVILDFTSLFQESSFNIAVELHRESIVGFGTGIGRYGNSQKEIVLEVSRLPLESLFAWGGYSSKESQLAEMWFGHKPSNQELDTFRELMRNVGRAAGPVWLSTPEAVGRVSDKLKKYSGQINEIRAGNRKKLGTNSLT